MSKVNPPELKRLMDKKMTSEWKRGRKLVSIAPPLLAAAAF